ncbi:hypothetical protein GGR54DRAFT_642921 [Hypoxylon sp. NC1633]|nr:hypothetical protein GGR54DRAFT_642921 [Hypoxylon sp. NC1633]
MPTFVTREAYACSHSLETCHQSFGTDGDIVVDLIPIPNLCLACLCQSLLDAVFPLDGDDDDHDNGMVLNRVPLSRLAELAKHLELLLTQKQHNGVAYDCEGYASERKQARDLERLRSTVLTPVDAGEFRSGLLALSGYPEIDPGFIFSSIDKSFV